MNLNLAPNEMFDTSKDLYDTAAIYQHARDSGIEAARISHKKQQDKERKQQESLSRLREQTGG